MRKKSRGYGGIIILAILLSVLLPERAVFSDDAFPDSTQLQDVQGLYSQLMVFSRLGQYDKVISGCKIIIRQDQTFREAYDLLVHSAYAQDKKSQSRSGLESVMQFFNKLMKDDPHSFSYWYGAGLAHKYSGNHTEAVKCFERSIFQIADFWKVYEEFINSLGSKSQIESAIKSFHNRLDNNPNNPYVNQALGYLYFWLDDYAHSMQFYQKALELIRERNNRSAEADCLYYLSYLNMYLNDYSRAEELIRKSIDIAKKEKLKFQEARALELIAFIYIETGNYDLAFELCRSALALAQEISSKTLQIVCYRTLGVIHLGRGNFVRAHNYLDRCSKFYSEIGEQQKLGITLYWQALLYHDSGDFSKALECCNRGLEISQKLGFRTGQAFQLSAIGDIYLHLGDYDRALNYNLRALDISKKYIGKWSRVECFHTIGSVYMQMNQYQKALDSFKQALDYAEKIGHKREIPKGLSVAGMAHFKMNNFSEAYDCFTRSMDYMDQNGNKTISGILYNCLGELCRQQNHLYSSEQYYTKALSVGLEVGSPDIIWEAYSGLGKISSSKKEYSRAIDYYKRAVEVIEDVRSQISISEHSSGFFKSKISVYEELINLLYERHLLQPGSGYDKECFLYTEKAKARAFLDDLLEAKIDFSKLLSFSKNRTKIQSLSSKISLILTDLNSNKLSRERRKELWNELENIEDELANLWELVKKEYPGYADELYSEPAKYEQIKKNLLDENTGIAEYFVGENNIFIFFCSINGLHIKRISENESRSVLEIVNNYVKLLSSSRFAGSDCETAGNNLYKMLLKPGNNGFTTKIEKLIIIPDRDLYYLPFETLVYKRRDSQKDQVSFLVNKYKISYAPSFTTLIQILQRPHKKNRSMELLAVGDPVYKRKNHLFSKRPSSDDIVYDYYMNNRFNIRRLRYASQELKDISVLFEPDMVRLISRKDASEENIKKLLLKDYKIIHFATHSLLDEQNAGRSALVLNLDEDPSEDGFFQAREIYEAEMNADLVVLSACQTARGKIEKGEGIQGLSRAFFCSGARSVLASLWNVNDKFSSLFMKHYYGYLSGGATTLEALRLAKIRMLQSGYDQPYYWAAFILIGESDTAFLQKGENL